MVAAAAAALSRTTPAQTICSSCTPPFAAALTTGIATGLSHTCHAVRVSPDLQQRAKEGQAVHKEGALLTAYLACPHCHLALHSHCEIMCERSRPRLHHESACRVLPATRGLKLADLATRPLSTAHTLGNPPRGRRVCPVRDLEATSIGDAHVRALVRRGVL